MSDTDPMDSVMNDPDPPPSDKAATAKAKKEIPVVSVPHDDDVIAQEMAELFEEDEVTHQHGNTEPEGD